MTVIFSEEAKQAIEEICEFVESLNTNGSGLRFYSKFTDKIKKKFLHTANYALCKNHWLAEMNLHCITIDKKWIVAYKQEGSICVIHYIILGSLL